MPSKSRTVGGTGCFLPVHQIAEDAGGQGVGIFVCGLQVRPILRLEHRDGLWAMIFFRRDLLAHLEVFGGEATHGMSLTIARDDFQRDHARA